MTINFCRVAKAYGSFEAIKPLTLNIGRGELFGLLGPNGAGKTTLIRMMTGILVPSFGQVRIHGFDCHSERSRVASLMGYLPEAPIFYDYLRGRELLQFIAEMHGLNRREAAERAAGLLAEFGLGDVSHEFVTNYSLGLKKRIGLAAAFIHDPEVLVLDEPTNGLDPKASREVQDRLRQATLRGKTIFMSTHLMDVAERMCSRVAILHRGELLADGSVEAIKTSVVSGSLEECFLKMTEASEVVGINSGSVP